MQERKKIKNALTEIAKFEFVGLKIYLDDWYIVCMIDGMNECFGLI